MKCPVKIESKESNINLDWMHEVVRFFFVLVGSFALAQRPGPTACPGRNQSCEQMGMVPCSIQAWKNYRGYFLSWGCNGTTVSHVSTCDVLWTPECCWSGQPNECVTPSCPCHHAE